MLYLFIFKFLTTKDITYKKKPKLLHTISNIFCINTTKHNWNYRKSFSWHFRYVIQLIIVKKKETYLVFVNGANSSLNRWTPQNAIVFSPRYQNLAPPYANSFNRSTLRKPKSLFWFSTTKEVTYRKFQSKTSRAILKKSIQLQPNMLGFNWISVM